LNLSRLKTRISKPFSPEPSDRKVIDEIIAGEVDKYQIIMRRYNQRMYRMARSILTDDERAMDAVQEAHICAFLKLNSFNGVLGFPAWLSQIARNQALMAVRKFAAESATTSSYNATEIPAKASFEPNQESQMNFKQTKTRTPEQMVENQQLREQLNSHIDNLPENFRTVFVMRGVEQLSTRETALILDIKETTVKTRFHRAKNLLQSQFKSEYRESIYLVGGTHCDLIVKNVLARIHSKQRANKNAPKQQ